MTEITCTFNFCYGHRLLGYDGKCSRLHGHNARLEVTFGAEELVDGFVIDFTIAKQLVKKIIDADYDHFMILESTDPVAAYLVDTNEPCRIVLYRPTAELLATALIEEIRAALETSEAPWTVFVKRVVLWETVDNSVTVTL